MNETKFFMHRIRRVNGVWDKGIEIKDTFADAKQAFHAQMAAYGYGQNKDCDYCSCLITDMSGTVVLPFSETWIAPAPAPAAE